MLMTRGGWGEAVVTIDGRRVEVRGQFVGPLFVHRGRDEGWRITELATGEPVRGLRRPLTYHEALGLARQLRRIREEGP